MTNRQWLKQEINQWVDDGVITDEEGRSFRRGTSTRGLILTGRRFSSWRLSVSLAGFSFWGPGFGTG